MRRQGQVGRAPAGRRALIRCLLLIGMLAFCHVTLSSASSNMVESSDQAVAAPMAMDGHAVDGTGNESGTSSLVEECALLAACALGAIGLGSLLLRRRQLLGRVLWLNKPGSLRVDGLIARRPRMFVHFREPAALVC